MHKIYLNTIDEVWVINDILAISPGLAFIRLHPTGNVTIFSIGVHPFILDVDPATIYSDEAETTTYADADDLLTTCAALFKKTIWTPQVLLSNPAYQSRSGALSDLAATLTEIVVYMKSYENQINALANAVGTIAFDSIQITTAETALTFTITSPSTDTDILDFDDTEGLVKHLVDAKYNLTSIAYISSDAPQDETVYIHGYRVDGGVETLIATEQVTVLRKQSMQFFPDDYIVNVADAPRLVRFKLSSTNDTGITLDSYTMKITASNVQV